MANVINTRIQLKYDTLANWQTNNPTLLSGEIAIATIGNSHTTTTPDNGTHPVVFKVGPGAYNDLPFTSALAADVYAWAKQDKLTITKNGTGNVVSGIEWDASLNDGKGGIKFSTAAVATAEGLEELQETVKAINDTLATYGDIVTHNASEFQPAGNYKTKQTVVGVKGAANQTLKISQDENGVITTEAVDIAIASNQVTDLDTGVHAVSLASGTNNGTVKLTVDGTATDNIAVTGLKSAAFTDSTAYATAAQGTTADKAAEDIADILDGTKEVKNAAYAIEAGKVSNKLKVTGGTNYFTGNKEYDGSAEVELDFSTLDSKVKSVSDKADTTASKLDAFLEGVTPDGSDDIIDTLAEINQYITSDTSAFTGLSERVTKIENGTVKAGDADKLDGYDSTYFATAEDLSDLNETVAKMAIAPEEGGTGVAYATKAGEATTATTASKVENALKIQYSDSDIEEYNGDETVTIDLSAYQPAGNYKTKQAAVLDPSAQNTSTTFIRTIAQDENGVITATKANLPRFSFEGEVLNFGNDTISLEGDEISFGYGSSGSDGSTLKATIGDNSIAKTKLTTDVQASLDKADAAIQPSDLAEIATTGSIYDVVEGTNTSTGTDTGVEYLIFNCGSATTII